MLVSWLSEPCCWFLMSMLVEVYFHSHVLWRCLSWNFEFVSCDWLVWVVVNVIKIFIVTFIGMVPTLMIERFTNAFLLVLPEHWNMELDTDISGFIFVFFYNELKTWKFSKTNIFLPQRQAYCARRNAGLIPM